MGEIKLIRGWAPFRKTSDNEFEAILSDTSIDRDGEFMTKELLESWAKNKAIPMLANHQNQMEKFIGVVKNLRVMTKGRNSALIGKPYFFEDDPLAQSIKSKTEQALKLGLRPGLSIGAIPDQDVEMAEREVNGKTHRGFKKAELVELTVVPVQSNRGASFQEIAKSFGFTDEQVIEKGPPLVEMCVARKLNEGKSNEEAFSSCIKEVYPGGTDHLETKSQCDCKITEKKEENTMEKESYSKEEVDALVKEMRKDLAEEVVAELEKRGDEGKDEEKKDEDKKKKDEEKKGAHQDKKDVSELDQLRKELDELKRNRFADMSKAPTVEEPVEEETEKSLTVESMLSKRYGVKY